MLSESDNSSIQYIGSIYNILRSIETLGEINLQRCVIVAEEDITYTDFPIVGLPLLRAAGGVVIYDGKLLCIKKYGMWEVPKGKLDSGESLEACALRETCEETGLNIDLLLIKDHYEPSEYVQRYLGTEYHKIVNWYKMDFFSSGEAILRPAKDEGIEECKWIQIECLVSLNMRGYAAFITKNIAYELSL